MRWRQKDKDRGRGAGSTSQSVGSTPAALHHHLRRYQKHKFLDCVKDMLNQKLWGWDEGICSLTCPLGDSDAPSSLRTTDMQMDGWVGWIDGWLSGWMDIQGWILYIYIGIDIQDYIYRHRYRHKYRQEYKCRYKYRYVDT